MKYTEVKNPQWDKEKKSINCIVNFDSLGELPFSASADDITQHGLEIYNRCIAGDFGPVADYAPAPDEGPQEPTILPSQQLPVTTPGEVL